MDVDYILNEKYTKNVFLIRLFVKQVFIQNCPVKRQLGFKEYSYHYTIG